MSRSFTRAELEAFVGAEVDDLVGEDPRLVVVGINPGLWTAAINTHFAHPSNRFWPALRVAGVVTRDIPSTGMGDQDRAHVLERGIAITNLVARATVRASDLTREELREGGMALSRRVASWGPRVVVIAGVTAYRTAFRRPKAVEGRQDESLGCAQLWVVPNPSGLNAHETVGTLAAKYAAPARAAGIL